MKDDDARDDVRTKDAAQATPVRGEIAAPPASSADADLTARLRDEAHEAELRAAEARARVERARTGDVPR